MQTLDKYKYTNVSTSTNTCYLTNLLWTLPKYFLLKSTFVLRTDT